MFHEMETSQTLLINEQSRNLSAGGKKIYSFGFGQCPFAPPALLQQALCDHAGKHEYTAVQGILPLRTAISEFYKKHQNLEFPADNIFIGPGSKALIYCLLASFKKVNVFMPSPAWVSYAPQAEMLGHDVCRVPTSSAGGWRMTPEILDQELKKTTSDTPSLLVITYPDNPTGLTYTEEELQKLAAVLRRHKVIVLADEIYGYMTHSGNPVSIASYYPEGTIISTGLSKWAGVGGWRLGVMMAPDALIEGLRPVLLGMASEIYSCAPTPVQYAAITAYSDAEEMQHYRQSVQQLLAAVGNYSQKSLAEGGIEVHPPAGGFYLFIDFEPFRAALAGRNISTGSELCQALLEDVGVALLPASAFGMDNRSLAARLCYVNFDGDAMLEAVQSGEATDDTFVEKYAPDTVAGIQKIVEWVRG